jgi:hypothetical protein
VNCLRRCACLALCAGLLGQVVLLPAWAQPDPIQITELNVAPHDDGSGFQISITATNTGGAPATRTFVVLDQPPQGAPYPIFSGYETTACIQINLPGATEGTCPKPSGQPVPPQGVPILPGPGRPGGTCMEIGQDDGQLQIASSANDQACAKPCNYGVIMSVGFKTAADLDLPNKPPRQHALMDANATALQGALIDNWGFPAKDLQNYTFTNTPGIRMDRELAHRSTRRQPRLGGWQDLVLRGGRATQPQSAGQSLCSAV